MIKAPLKGSLCIHRTYFALPKNYFLALLVEQNAKQALKISDRAYLMNTGKIVVAGTGDDFLKGDVLTSVYLGGKKE